MSKRQRKRRNLLRTVRAVTLLEKEGGGGFGFPALREALAGA
jgi:hypothetical protein